jgi:hypothetical protein
VLCQTLEAQSTHKAETTIAALDLPEAPHAQATASLTGNVQDPSGAIIPGALVTLTSNGSASQHTTADSSGSFSFQSLPAGTLKITVTAPGFNTWVATDISLSAGQTLELPQIELPLAPASTEIEVFSSTEALAEYQLQAEEKQRVFGLFPNFYVTYIPDAAPLSPKQKFKLAFRTVIDPVTFAGPAIAAGFEQWQNEFSGYGQGVKGYAKRFGASYTDGFDATMIGGAILPTLLHQDPRYFHKGTGSIRSRTLYALSSAVICKGDNGKRQPNYSNVLGNLAGGAISNLYYPASSRNGPGLTVGNAMLGVAGNALGAIFQEFLVPKISTGIQK